ncbi:GGDEF domain-containing protein [Shewanella acanthi]|uniref:GGDEF domain-containing protein n=1 Tax=Shewanella acanthi TaxID=2864212 RepID=UPI001C659D4B|nr:sensor domain-containing diguanylate cyclase [Shewanella acanthi]QYJ78324.1 GGDEF domain-containing protein [Shewanella acanthi]
MIQIQQLALILDALPDPAFIISKSGQYLAVFGGKDGRYYHDGSSLVGLKLTEVLNSDKAEYFQSLIDQALASRSLIIEEYELCIKDVKGIPEAGPSQPIWFEGRIQALDFLVEGEPVVLWVASNISQRHELEIQLRQLSDTDQLTGLFNRRRLVQDLSALFDNFSYHKLPSSVLILDLDNLKAVNDQLGHHVGDEIMRAIADTCKQQFRKTDNAYRYGGDEFVITLASVEQPQAISFAEHLLGCFFEALQQHAINGIYATVSIGVASFEAGDKSYEDALRRADAALYQAKRNGKNQVIVKTA